MSDPRSVLDRAPGTGTGRVLARLDTLSVHYLGGGDAWVLDGVHLAHLAGQVTAVIGPSGCGKSTLVRTLCGLIPHSLPSEYAGSVHLAGEEVADADVAFLCTHAAYVGQNPDAAVVTRTVRDDVRFPLQNLCLDRAEIEARTDAALRATGLAPLADRDPWTLSGGQRQRLALAAAIAVRAPLLVLDEPTATVDALGRTSFYRLVADLVSRGAGVVVIDHDLDPVLPIVDQVLALDAAGRPLALGHPSDVFATHRDALAATGVWIPRALRAPATGDAPRPLTCDQAGIRLPALPDLCDTDDVRYLRRGPAGWEPVAALDTRAPAPDAHAPTTPALRLVGLRVPGRTPEISLTLRGGELVGVVGPNGAGKSSLLSALAGLLPFEATVAEAGGAPIRRGRHRIGYVFQNPEHQFVASTVERELAVGGVRPDRVEALLTRFHLADHRDRHPLTLSGGQARRLSVATVVSDPRDIIVLDEPTYGQDWANTVELMGFIDTLRADGHTVVMATHDLELATTHCTHLVALPTTATPAPESRATSPTPPPAAGAASGSWTSGLNPLTWFLAGLGPIAALLWIHDVPWNLAAMAAMSLLIVSARLPVRRTLAAVGAMWLIAAFLTWALATLIPADSTLRGYAPGSAPVTGTTVGAILGIVVFAGAATDPEALLRTLTTTCRLPYRVGAAGTAALTFLTRLHHDLRLLCTARALRGIGDRWGPLAPAVRWVSALLPLTVLAVRHAERVALSMDSRAFGAHPRRTEMRDEPWRPRDLLVVAFAWAAAAGLLIATGTP